MERTTTDDTEGRKKKKEDKRNTVDLTREGVPDAKEFYGQFIHKEWPEKIPILYSSSYNISFLGLEKLHPFDSCKYKNVIAHLEQHKVVKEKEIIEVTKMPTREQLQFVHDEKYLDSLNSSLTVAHITEVAPVAMLPNFLVWWKVLNPMLYATAGTIAAGYVAANRGWAINVGGGFHHCCAYQGGGFCPFADLTLSIRYLRRHMPQYQRVMLIDLDAHQGNGHERDKIHFHDNDLFIVDMYNGSIYPGDHDAKDAINIAKVLRSGTPECYYNAGTDILDGDPLGRLDVSAEGVVRRDEMVFQFARSLGIPIVMALSGGYQKSNAAVIGDSIRNLREKGFFTDLKAAAKM